MNKDDEKFAQEAMRRGHITPQHVAAARKARNKIAETGVKPPPLAKILVDQKAISAEDAAGLHAILSGEGTLPSIPGYTFIKPLGSGGMGHVYLAKQEDLGRLVAVKTLFSEIARDEEYVERFKREARIAASIDHPGVVRAYNFGEANGVLFLVMEYVAGETVYDLLRRGKKFTEREALHVVLEVARALSAVHPKGIVHRDIKPDNIMITKGEGGRPLVKLCDLGLAKLLGSGDNLTLSGMTSGSPYYISPEQAKGLRRVDTRADVWSLGATLYRMIAGRPPFDGSTAAEIMLACVSEPYVPLEKRGVKVSEPTRALIDRMLRKNPDERYQEPEALAADITRCLEGKMPEYQADRQVVDNLPAPKDAPGKDGVGDPAPPAPETSAAAREPSGSPREQTGKRRPAWMPAALALAISAAALGAGFLAGHFAWPKEVRVVVEKTVPGSRVDSKTEDPKNNGAVVRGDAEKARLKKFIEQSTKVAQRPQPPGEEVIEDMAQDVSQATESFLSDMFRERQMRKVEDTFVLWAKDLKRAYADLESKVDALVEAGNLVGANQAIEDFKKRSADSEWTGKAEALAEDRVFHVMLEARDRLSKQVATLIEDGDYARARELLDDFRRRSMVDVGGTAEIIARLGAAVDSAESRRDAGAQDVAAVSQTYEFLRKHRKALRQWRFARVLEALRAERAARAEETAYAANLGLFEPAIQAAAERVLPAVRETLDEYRATWAAELWEWNDLDGNYRRLFLYKTKLDKKKKDAPAYLWSEDGLSLTGELHEIEHDPINPVIVKITVALGNLDAERLLSRYAGDLPEEDRNLFRLARLDFEHYRETPGELAVLLKEFKGRQHEEEAEETLSRFRSNVERGESKSGKLRMNDVRSLNTTYRLLRRKYWGIMKRKHRKEVVGWFRRFRSLVGKVIAKEGMLKRKEGSNEIHDTVYRFNNRRTLLEWEFTGEISGKRDEIWYAENLGQIPVRGGATLLSPWRFESTKVQVYEFTVTVVTRPGAARAPGPLIRFSDDGEGEDAIEFWPSFEATGRHEIMWIQGGKRKVVGGIPVRPRKSRLYRDRMYVFRVEISSKEMRVSAAASRLSGAQSFLDDELRAALPAPPPEGRAVLLAPPGCIAYYERFRFKQGRLALEQD